MKFTKRKSNIKIDKKLVKEYSDKFNVSETLVEIMFNREIRTEEDISRFLSDSDKYYNDPFLLTDMKRAVDRLNKAFINNEQITIWGDYDVDGTSASSILYLAIKGKGYKEPKIYIPDRHKEGYGLSEEGISKILEDGTTSLLITVDCGITSKDLVEKLVLNGVDVIVTDHHEVPDEIPYCTAVIDPKRPGDKYPESELCGGGVAFKLTQALFGFEYAEQFVDIAGFSTVADIVPLTGENRIFVKRSLEKMNSNPRLGFKKLIKQTCSEKEVLNAYHYGFRLGPAVNAVGRLSHAKYAVALFITENEENATKLAKWMKGLNDTRKQIEEDIKEKSFAMAEKNLDKKILISYGTGWNSGVIGIVASRITEEYNRPAIVFSYDPETGLYKGSARSIPGISIYKALKFADEFILKWGGHDAAAGLTVEAKNFRNFCESIQGYMDRIDDKYFTKEVKYDAEVPLALIDEKMIENLSLFEPFGMDNPSIKFKLDNADMVNAKLIGSEKNHSSFLIRDTKDNTEIKGIQFNAVPPSEKTNLSIIYKPQINEFKGNRTIQLNVEEIKDGAEKDIEVQFSAKPNNIPLEYLGVTRAKEKQFNSAGIYSANDLLDYLPKDYDDFRELTPSSSWVHGEKYAIVGTILNKKVFKTGTGFFLSCKDDDSNFFLAMFFGQNYAYNMFKIGNPYFFSGKVSCEIGQPVSITPIFFSNDVNKYKRLVPNYRKIKGMSNDYLDEKILSAMRNIEAKDVLEEEIINEYNLCTKPEAIMYAHRPKDFNQIKESQYRYLFDELFNFAFHLALNKVDMEEGSKISFFDREIMDSVISNLPYELTGDQTKSIEHIYGKVNSGERLNALIQGDVGCGKTIVSLLASVNAAENGYQACVIAPTEVLAGQHYEDFKNTLSSTEFNIGFLTGSTKASEKRKILKSLKEGEIDIIIGTHALIQDTVEFSNLGLLVIDEQHKFGVAQREKLEKIDSKPHVITMSATPIPRTLSMALLGSHIDVITIYDKPAGRKPIITKQMRTDTEVNNFMLSEIRKGHQCYIVCPLIEESTSEKMHGVESVRKTVEKTKKWFEKYPTVKISDISGKMKKSEIEEEIRKFKDGETQVLISTTIVEVGVNVPNSTVMVLKNSERFGLAQAHQLRGRVGRGNAQGYFILQTNIENEPKALALTASSDGFEISKADLKLRGSGDFLGTKQSGQNQDVLLMLANIELFEKIENTIGEIINDEERLEKYKGLLSTEE